jgi:phage replication O-like protein O
VADPQVENGFTRIANEIMDALMRTNLSAYQSRILWAIWRKTYGWKKREDWIANIQLVAMTGIRKQHVSRTVKELIERKMVTKSGYKIGFNKNYTQWRELPKQVTVTSSGNKVTDSGNGVTSSGEHKRNYNKRNNIYAQSFDEKFWPAYPRKVSKKRARQVWINLKPSQELVGEIMQSLAVYKETAEWKCSNGQYIPYPASWLNQARWEDEINSIPSRDPLSMEAMVNGD